MTIYDGISLAGLFAVALFAAWVRYDEACQRYNKIKNLSEEIDGLQRMVLRHKRSLDESQVRSEESHRLLQEYFDLELYTPPPANTKPYLRIKPVRNEKDES